MKKMTGKKSLQDAILEMNRTTGEQKKVNAEKEAAEKGALHELLWDTLRQYEGAFFYTAMNLEYTYVIKGNEMFVSRKDKSITRSTVNLAFDKALELQRTVGAVSGPKKLGCFGASYLYPVFREIGVITDPS